ncbi:MAG: RluA family pseudouridine synthase [Spirochaeta sp.]|nr:RluA family pseudouridine synthase [Spirochaeta sp.]
MPEPLNERHEQLPAGTACEVTVPGTETEADPSTPTAGRVDQYVSSLPDFPPRSQLKQRITALHVNGTPVKLSAKVQPGDTITFTLLPEIVPEVTGEMIDLDVVYEDTGILVINKAAGMVVHPGAGNWSGTLLHALMGRYRQDAYFSPPAATTAVSDESVLGEPHGDFPSTVRPGIVHRLDKDTSGVMIVAKNATTHQFLTAQFASRTTTKRYIALVKGSPIHTTGYIAGSLERDPRHRTRFRVAGNLQHETLTTLDTEVPGWTESAYRDGRGKPALTTYTVLRRFAGYTLVLLRPHTGRTHQLRVHLTAIGSPIVGDPVYARGDGKLPTAPLMLHALHLTIVTQSGGTAERFTAPVPEAFRRVIREVRTLTTAGRQPSRERPPSR